MEVLHRSATLALCKSLPLAVSETKPHFGVLCACAGKGPPKWLPFCACVSIIVVLKSDARADPKHAQQGLLSGAYSFLLLSLAVQASSFSETEEAPPSEELEALMTNVKVILAGLDAYGTMWDGIDMMAGWSYSDD